MRADRPRRDQTGTLSLELAIIAPMLLLLLFMFIAFGRFGQTTGMLEQAARDAARSATQTRSPADMWIAIDNVTAEVAPDLPSSCRESLGAPDVNYTGERRSFTPGTFVTVTYQCKLSFTDLMLPGSGGGGGWADREITRSFTSRLDPNRGVYR